MSTELKAAFQERIQNLDDESKTRFLMAMNIAIAVQQKYAADKVYVAGGFVLDTIMGRKPRDLDIYLVGNTNYVEEEHEESDPEYPRSRIIKNLPVGDSDLLSWNSLDRAALGAADFDLPIQIMISKIVDPITNSINGILSGFDMDVCMMAVDPSEPSELITCESTITLEALNERKCVIVNKNYGFKKRTLRYTYKGFLVDQSALDPEERLDIAPLTSDDPMVVSLWTKYFNSLCVIHGLKASPL